MEKEEDEKEGEEEEEEESENGGRSEYWIDWRVGGGDVLNCLERKGVKCPRENPQTKL